MKGEKMQFFAPHCCSIFFPPPHSYFINCDQPGWAFSSGLLNCLPSHFIHLRKGI